MMKNILKDARIIRLVAYLLVAVISLTFLNGIFTSLTFHKDTIETIDEQKANAMALDVVLASASTALTLLPDDMGSPIATELADMTDLVFVIVCVLYIEKFLLTTFGWIACSWMIPIACGIECVNVFRNSAELKKWSKRLILLALVLILVIPAGTEITQKINETFAETVNQVFEDAKLYAEEETVEVTEEGNAFVEFFVGVKDSVTGLVEDVAGVVEMAKDVVNVAVDAIAVLFITACVIPAITAVVFVWLFLRIMNIETPMRQVGNATNQARGMMKGFKNKLKLSKEANTDD